MDILDTDNPNGLALRYQASIFLDAASVVFNQDDAKKLLEDFAIPELLPGQAIDSSDSEAAPRLAFGTIDNRIQIALLAKRFDYSVNFLLDPRTPLGDFADFCQDAAAKFTILVGYYHRHPHRLATVQERFLPKMSEEELNHAVTQLFVLPKSASNTMPFEWDWRVTYEDEQGFAGISETINKNLIVKRMSGAYVMKDNTKIETETFDRIRLDLDLSTSHKETRRLFDVEQLQGFFREAPTWHNVLQEEMLTQITGSKRS